MRFVPVAWEIRRAWRKGYHRVQPTVHLLMDYLAGVAWSGLFLL